MADFLSLISAVPQLTSLFSGSTTDPNKKQKKQVSAALSDTTNPLYQQLYKQYRQQGTEALGKGISEVQAQNRLATRMGRTPLLSQERGGETLFRQLMSGYQTAGNNAASQTTQNLQQQLANLEGLSSGQIASNKSKSRGYQGIADLLRGKSLQADSGQSSNQSSTIEEFLKRIMGNAT
jgi:hypothetical protein